MLLVTSRESERWIIPKGNIDEGMTAAEAAENEAFEEAGVRGTIVGADPIGFYTYFKRLKTGDLLDTTVEVYLLRVERQHKKWPERKQRSVAWLPVREAIERVEEPSIAILLRRVGEIEASLTGVKARAKRKRLAEAHAY